MLVPELHARLSILDGEKNIVARLGDDVERVTGEKDVRSDRNRWIEGKFVHPHDACFDTEGNIYVAEWVATGRITKLRRLS